MLLITYRKCVLCGKYAGVVIVQGESTFPFCVGCSRMLNVDPRLVVYVCSVEGCSVAPEFITLLGNGDLSMTLLCPDHFLWCREDLSTVLVISKRIDSEERQLTDWEVHEFHNRLI